MLIGFSQLRALSHCSFSAQTFSGLIHVSIPLKLDYCNALLDSQCSFVRLFQINELFNNNIIIKCEFYILFCLNISNGRIFYV